MRRDRYLKHTELMTEVKNACEVFKSGLKFGDPKSIAARNTLRGITKSSTCYNELRQLQLFFSRNIYYEM